MGSPYINRFLQPDSIIPDQTNPQSWNRFAYVENDPINYSDVSGHFKCKVEQNSGFEGNCNEAIETLLTLLQEKGGEEGQALVEAFRVADGVSRYGRGGGYDKKDQISITVVQGDGSAAYLGSLNFSITAGLLDQAGDIDTLVNTGQFGHEIVHLTQDDPMDRILGISSGSLQDEIEAYAVQSEIYESMGLGPSDHGTVAYAFEVGSYVDESAESILSSRWAKAKGQYDNFPLFDGGNRQFDNWWYIKKPVIKPLPLHLFHGI